jgi:long-subunit acyl-CoA synthetase (AMP-forming)
MVQSTQGDGVHRPVMYAKFRTDKAATPGYSAELVSTKLDSKYYDNLDGMPLSIPDCDTVLKHFQRQATTQRDAPFLGTRPQLAEKDAKGGPLFGPYQWETYNQVSEKTKQVACAVRNLKMAEPVEGEKAPIRMCGIWAKNRAEWLTTLLGLCRVRTVAVGFYDAMGDEAVDFIIAQTQLQTIFCAGEYIDKVLRMKKNGLAASVSNIVTYDNVFSQK